MGRYMEERTDELAEFDGIACDVDTPKAILVTVEGKQVWIPKFAIHDDSEVYKKGTSGKLVVLQRIAEEKGLV
jgi:hypothetical protein